MNLRKSSSPTCDIVSILHRIPKRSPISRNSWKNSYFSQKVVITFPVIRTLFILLLTLTMVEYYSDYNRSIGRKVMPLMQLFWLPARQSTFVAYRRLLNLMEMKTDDDRLSKSPMTMSIRHIAIMPSYEL